MPRPNTILQSSRHSREQNIVFIYLLSRITIFQVFFLNKSHRLHVKSDINHNITYILTRYSCTYCLKRFVHRKLFFSVIYTINHCTVYVLSVSVVCVILVLYAHYDHLCVYVQTEYTCENETPGIFEANIYFLDLRFYR